MSMLFNSMRFLVFFPLACLVFYVCPKKWRPAYLTLISCFFYACFLPINLLVLLYVGALSYGAGRLLGKLGQHRRAALACALVALFAPLCLYKYTQFALNNLSTLLGLVGIGFYREVGWIAPIGISFFTFMGAGYLIDVYRGTQPEKNVFRYGAFITFFPVLASGPIERSSGLLKQLNEDRSFDADKVKKGLMMMCWGYFLKLVLADRLSLFVGDAFANYAQYGFFRLSLGAVAFGLQLYCDFASYSYLALGAGEVLGFDLIDNFNTPYFSKSVTEFWRRWHISLSSWFRDYLYFPLGGNRKGTLRKYLNVMIVMLVSGLWHGSTWNYIAWGGLHGVFQITGQALKPWRAKVAKALHINPDNAGNTCLRILFTFLLVNFAWIFFRAPSLMTALAYIRRMFTVWEPWVLVDGSLASMGLDAPNLAVTLVGMLILFCVSLCRYQGVDLRDGLLRQGVVFRWTVYLLCIFFVLIFGIWGPSYSASSFIYFQF